MLFRVMAIGGGVVVTQYLGSGNKLLVKQTALTVLSACTWLGIVASGRVYHEVVEALSILGLTAADPQPALAGRRSADCLIAVSPVRVL